MNGKHIFLIGPGGVGKSTTGPLLAALLHRPFVDLDTVFCDEIENIGTYMKREGYDAYARANADLAERAIRRQAEPMVMALSSGSLVTTGLAEVITQTRAIVHEAGISVALLPGGTLDEAGEIVIARQLTRGFGLRREPERQKFLDRAETYRALASICVDSSRSPGVVAREIFDRLRAR